MESPRTELGARCCQEWGGISSGRGVLRLRWKGEDGDDAQGEFSSEGARPGASRCRGLAGGQWSVVGTFGRYGQNGDSGGGRVMKNKAR